MYAVASFWFLFPFIVFVFFAGCGLHVFVFHRALITIRPAFPALVGIYRIFRHLRFFGYIGIFGNIQTFRIPVTFTVTWPPLRIRLLTTSPFLLSFISFMLCPYSAFWRFRKSRLSGTYTTCCQNDCSPSSETSNSTPRVVLFAFQWRLLQICRVVAIL